MKQFCTFIELKEGLLLAASYSDCSYYIVDLVNKKESLLCKGFSPYAMGLVKFPDFAFDGESPFPYVLAKEDDYLTIINPINIWGEITSPPIYFNVRAGFAIRLAHVPTHNQDHFSQRITFTTGDSRTFVTDQGSYYLAKYRMSEGLFKQLREIHLWAGVNGMLKY